MQYFKSFSLIFIILFLFSCTKNEIKKNVIQEKSLEFQVLEAYEEGLNSLERGDVVLQQKNLTRQKHYFLNQNGHQNLH